MFNPSIHPEPLSADIEFNNSLLNEDVISCGKIEFIHYTNLTSAMNILNSGNIRLYNCLNMNDPMEIKHLLEQSEIEFSDEEISTYQREHFIFSACRFNSNEDEDFNLWRLYGENGKGVGIVFEIDEKIKNWSNRYLQNVKYQMEDSRKIAAFFEYHKQFNETHDLFQNKPDLFALLAAGVKNQVWSIEKEFRIIVEYQLDMCAIIFEQKINSLFTYSGIQNNLSNKEVLSLFSTLKFIEPRIKSNTIYIYTDDNKNVRWCPYSGCDYCVEYQDYGISDV
jgi:hypothetical protein